MRSLRVLRAADVPNNRTGGMSRTMHCTGDELMRRGHKIDYIFHEDFAWSIPRQLQRYARAWEASSIIKRRLRAGERWDVIEMHEPLALAYGLACRRDPTLPPLVVFSYGIERRAYDAMRSYRKLKDIAFPVKSRITASLLVQQARAGVALASHVICSNQEDVDYLANVQHINPSRLTRHHSGVEDQFIETGKAIVSRPMKNMLFMGNWIERKGILDIVPAVTLALMRHPDAQFTVAGCNCPEEIVLRNFVSTVRGRIRVIPHIDDISGLIRTYRSHSILLLPSYFEGHPLVMVEAAAMGLAIVTTPVCGMLDFLSDGISGRFSPVGDPDRLGAILCELLGNPIQAEQLGRQAQQTASTHTWDDAGARIEAAYFRAVE